MFIFGAGVPESYQQDIFEYHIKSGTGLQFEFLPGAFLPLLTFPELKVPHYLPALTDSFLAFIFLFPGLSLGRPLRNLP